MLEAGGGGGGQGGGSAAPSFVCPTMPCQWLASTLLRSGLSLSPSLSICISRFASLAVSHHNMIVIMTIIIDLICSISRFASLAVSHQNTIPLFFVFLSFVIWLYDCITDMVMYIFFSSALYSWCCSFHPFVNLFLLCVLVFVFFFNSCLPCRTSSLSLFFIFFIWLSFLFCFSLSAFCFKLSVLFLSNKKNFLF